MEACPLTKTQLNSLNYVISNIVSGKFLMSVRMKLSTCAGQCITVLILRISCVSEKGDFLQKYCSQDNIVCALCRHQAETELVSLET